MVQSMKVVERKISELIPAEYNPRYISDEQLGHLKASIQRFEAVEPVLVNMHPDRKNIIISGHQRIKAAKSLGMTEFPCVELNLDRDKERELNIRMNKNTGGWDWDELANHFDTEELTEWGFTEEELFGDGAFGEEEPEAKEDDYEIPDEIETDIVLGDLIEIGEHRLLCGDSTDSDQVAKLMGGEKADMVFTDPPYGVNKEGISNDELQGDDFYQFSSDYISIAPVKEDVGMVCYHSTRTFYHTLNAFIDNGWKFEKMLFFYRPDKMPVHTWNGWMMTSQAIMLFSKGSPEYKSISPAHQDVYRVTSKDLTEKSVKHPTVKPVTNCADLLSHYDAYLIYEPFLGSGSTMVACHQLNRKCYGMELDPKYCQVILDRMKKLDPSLEIKVNGEKYG